MADVNLGVKIEADAQGILDLKQHLIDLKKQLVELRQQKLDIADKGRLADINDQIRRTAVEIQSTNVKIQEMNYNLQKNMVSALANGGQAAQQMSMAMQSLNFVIRDSPYFFRDFALGLLAVGNNLNPLIDSFIRAKQAAEQQNISFMALMKQGLMGTSGIILGFSLLVSILQAVVFWKEKTKEKTEENTKALEREQAQLEKNIEAFLRYKANLPAYREGEELIKGIDEQIKGLEEQKKAIEENIKAQEEAIRLRERRASTQQYDVTYSRDIERLNRELELLNIQLETQNNKLKELRTEKEKLIKQQQKYTELTELGNKVSKEGIKVLQDYIKQTKPLYAEYDILIAYLTEQLRLSKDNSQEAKNFALAIDFLRQKTNELTDAIKNSRKETQQWIKDLIKQDEKEFKERLKNEKEITKQKEQQLKTSIDEDPIQKLLNYYLKQKADANKDLIEQAKKDIAELSEKQNKINETQQDRLELQQWELKNLRLQFDALGDIAMALDSITGKTNDWGRRIASILQYIVQIATVYEKMGSEEVSETTGWLQVIAGAFKIVALFASGGASAGFQSGGIIGGEGGRAIPIIAHEGEMVLNKEQQRNLFKMINYGFVAPSNSLNVRIDGSIKAKKSDFIVEFKRAEKLIYKSNL